MLPISSGLFVDAEFPASVSSLVRGACTPLSLLCDRITWLRPQEISASPRLFPKIARDGLGKQGILGDCWFICACSALQKCEQFLHQAFPHGPCAWTDPGYIGKFTCRFWRFGHWVDVTIDDRLPCLGRKLCFSHCQDQNAFWLPLLEKAYAKLHGCYEALWAGQVADALLDLTGGLVERWPLGAGEQAVQERMFNKILELKERCAMSCSVLHYRKGVSELGEFHAFTITDIQLVVTKDGQELMMLCVHNPWGRSCWDGSWGKSGQGWNMLSPQVSSRLKSEMREGEFWVEKSEFIRNFDEITMAFPVSEKGHVINIWSGMSLAFTQEVYGSWLKGLSAGGSRNNATFPDNPKFWLRVREQSEVYLVLNQRPLHDTGSAQNKDSLFAIGLHAWKVEKHKFNLNKTLSSSPVVGTSSHSYDRQIHLHGELSLGYHLLVPSTFLRDSEGHFFLRVLSTGRINLSEMTPPRPVPLPWEDETQGSWEFQKLHGIWEKGKSAGGSRNFPSYHINPSLPFTVPKGCHLVKLTLRQQCDAENCLAIGFHVYTVSGKKHLCPLSGEPCASCVPHCHTQEVSQLCVLSPGQYVLVPSTYLPEQESIFTATIAAKVDRKPIQSQETLGRQLQEVCVISVMK